MEPDLRSIQNAPLVADDFEIAPYEDHFVAKSLQDLTYVFVDAEEKFLLETLQNPTSIARLVQLYHERFKKRSYSKIFGLIARLLEASFFSRASEKALLRHPRFSPFAPRRFAAARSWERAAWLLSPVMSFMDSLLAILPLAALAALTIVLLVVHAGATPLLAVESSLFKGLFVWALLFSAVVSLKNCAKYLILRAKGLDAPSPRLVARRGFIRLAVNDGDITLLDWSAVARFHLAALLFPALLAAPALILFHLYPVLPVLYLWGLACVVVMFVDLSPFLDTELREALDRLSGRARLTESLRAFVQRRFLHHVFAFRSAFEREGWFVAFGVYSLLWIGAAYALVGCVTRLWFDRLIDAAFLSRSPFERSAAIVYLLALLAPLLLLLFGFLWLLGVNLTAIFQKPIDRALKSLFRMAHRGVTEDEKIRRLEDIPLFAAMSRESLEGLAKSFRVEYYPRGRAVVWQGDPGEAFYVIHEGRARVIVENRAGARSVVAELGEGDSFGEIALLERHPRTASVRAKTPLVCLALSKDNFERFVAAYVDDRERVTSQIQTTAYLRNLPLFAETPGETLSRVVRDIEQRQFQRGEVLMREGDPGESFMVLRSGAAKVWKDYGRPEQAREIATVGDGDFLGEIALMDNSTRTATVVAESVCQALVIPREAFHALLQTNLFAGVMIEETLRSRRKALCAR